jgi:hypothetical protein
MTGRDGFLASQETWGDYSRLTYGSGPQRIVKDFNLLRLPGLLEDWSSLLCFRKLGLGK